LRKLPANLQCPDCAATHEFGFSGIVEKFNTFVCNDCKSSHQSFSHRVKSVTMSNWTHEDVDKLREENGGGNANAVAKWQGPGVPANLKPKDGDDLNKHKRFIEKVYVMESYKNSGASSHSSSRPAASSGGGGGGGGGGGSGNSVKLKKKELPDKVVLIVNLPEWLPAGNVELELEQGANVVLCLSATEPRSFSRRVRLPPGLKVDSIEAEATEDGQFEISIPRIKPLTGKAAAAVSD
jgi:HSP20 family molecular chaperone IbpA